MYKETFLVDHRGYVLEVKASEYLAIACMVNAERNEVISDTAVELASDRLATFRMANNISIEVFCSLVFSFEKHELI